MRLICSEELFETIVASLENDKWTRDRYSIKKLGTELEIWVANLPFFDWHIFRPQEISFTMSQKVRLIKPLKKVLDELNSLYNEAAQLMLVKEAEAKQKDVSSL